MSVLSRIVLLLLSVIICTRLVSRACLDPALLTWLICVYDYVVVVICKTRLNAHFIICFTLFLGWIFLVILSYYYLFALYSVSHIECAYFYRSLIIVIGHSLVLSITRLVIRFVSLIVLHKPFKLSVSCCVDFYIWLLAVYLLFF